MVRPLSNINLALNRMQAIQSAGIAPDELDNLDIWWDPSDGDNTTESGGKFTTLANKGTGGTATLLPPAANTAGFTAADVTAEGGLNWLGFAGAEAMRLPGTNVVYPRGSASCTFVAVFRTEQNTSFATFLQQGLTTGTSPGWIVGANHTGTPDTWQFATRDASLLETENLLETAVGISDGETHTIMCVRDNDAGANGQVIMYLDGVAVQSADLTSGYGSIDEPYTATWEDLMIGSRPAGGTTVYQAGSEQLQGDTMIFGDALTPEEITGLHNWLMAKWGG